MPAILSHQVDQPLIDPTLMLLHRGYLKCNLYLDLHGSYCPLTKDFTVEQVSLSGTEYDLSTVYCKSDFDAFDAYVNERLDGDDFEASGRTEAYAMQRDEVAA